MAAQTVTVAFWEGTKGPWLSAFSEDSACTGLTFRMSTAKAITPLSNNKVMEFRGEHDSTVRARGKKEWILVVRDEDPFVLVTIFNPDGGHLKLNNTGRVVSNDRLNYQEEIDRMAHRICRLVNGRGVNITDEAQ